MSVSLTPGAIGTQVTNETIIPTPLVASVYKGVLVPQDLSILMALFLFNDIDPDLGAKQNPEDLKKIPPYSRVISSKYRCNYAETTLIINSLVEKALIDPEYKKSAFAREYFYALAESIYRGYADATDALLAHADYYLDSINGTPDPFGRINEVTFQEFQKKIFGYLTDPYVNEMNIFDFLRILDVLVKRNFKLLPDQEIPLILKVKKLIESLDPIKISASKETFDSLYEKSVKCIFSQLCFLRPEGLKV